MGLGAVIYVQSFVKIGSSVKMLTGEIHRHTHTYTHMDSNVIS
jgi:hypothetical protein